MIKALLILFLLIILVILIYFIWVKFHRLKIEKRIYHLLLEEYLGKSYQLITSIIEKDPIEKKYNNEIETDDNYKYLFTHSRNQKTLKVYQFLNNTCTGFYIHSNEDRYSLPYWKYVNGYMDNYTESSNVVPTDNEPLELAIYTAIKFIEPFEDTEEYLYPENDDYFYFKKYFKVGDHRYLSINIKIPTIPRFKGKACYSYLCSSHPKHMEIFRQKLIVKPDFMTPDQTTGIKIQERKDHKQVHQTDGERQIQLENKNQVEAE